MLHALIAKEEPNVTHVKGDAKLQKVNTDKNLAHFLLIFRIRDELA
jgi:hypothetical protein